MSLEKNPRIESLKAALKAAKKEVARIKQELAVVSAQSVEIPAEPVPQFVFSYMVGPDTCSDIIEVQGVTPDEEFRGGLSGYVRSYPLAYGGKWVAFLHGDRVPEGGHSFSSDSWSEVVIWLRENFAKYSALLIVDKAA